MNLTNEEIRNYINRLLLSRMRILNNNGFYGLLLMHMNFAIDEQCDTAYTNGDKIAFSPKFLNIISNDELDFVMMHEILHVVLKHCFRGYKADNLLFNIACDIVVNSNILYSNKMNLNSITLKKYGVSMHLTPDGKEGYDYTAEEVYKLLIRKFIASDGLNEKGEKPGKGGIGGKISSNNNTKNDDNFNDFGDNKKKEKGNNGIENNQDNFDFDKLNTIDDHSKWDKDESKEKEDEWNKRIADAYESISIRDSSTTVGKIPLCAQRIFKELTSPKIDWRIILNEFIEEEINDYSFTPPDRRYNDSPFFLPDYNDSVETVKNILFFIDASGSMSDKDITEAFSEIKGAIDQFDGKLSGLLGYFDSKIHPPVPFETVDELLKIKPVGGGGTSFSNVFKYINECMNDIDITSIIILTDGYDKFPNESVANSTPVLWIINNDKVTPPWGKVARLPKE